MTTSAQVRAAWDSNVWANATVTAITPKIYAYDVTQESEDNPLDLAYQQQINCFSYIVTRQQVFTGTGGQTEQTFTVEVRYYKQADTTGDAFNAVIDAHETVEDIVKTQLGSTWSGTIYFYQTSGTIELSQVTLDDKPVWLGVYRYIGTARP